LADSKDRHRPGYWQERWREILSKRKPGRKRLEPTVVLHLRVKESQYKRWQQVAGEQKLAAFVREAVDSYVADVEEGADAGAEGHAIGY
jgi:hypothetical protein